MKTLTLYIIKRLDYDEMLLESTEIIYLSEETAKADAIQMTYDAQQEGWSLEYQVHPITTQD